jgi:UPF0755 protein
MRKSLAAVVVLLVIAAAAAAVSRTAIWGRLHDPFKGYPGEEQYVILAPGTGTAAIGRHLVEAGVIRDELAFRAALWWTGRSRELQAGEYRFDRPMAAVDVVERLARGDVYTRRLTFPEGLTIREMAEIFEARGFGARASFIEAAANVSLIEDLDGEADDLEGYLFPETYALPRETPAARLIRMMVDRFRATYVDEWRRRADEQRLTTRQVVTLASLVEKETARAAERPIVAAVYRNRVKIGMALQADPTVIYAMQKAGTYNGNIRRDDLAIDSPYNTYRYPGFPPGPIAAPGAAALEAVLMPAAVSYLYFVSRNDGSHVFAESLAEHNRNVREFQVLYFRRSPR